tara:strand:- start:378 stop:521 length:144 start_codon:yes stop_codon:yes gene_type:complete
MGEITGHFDQFLTSDLINHDFAMPVTDEIGLRGNLLFQPNAKCLQPS